MTSTVGILPPTTSLPDETLSDDQSAVATTNQPTLTPAPTWLNVHSTTTIEEQAAAEAWRIIQTHDINPNALLADTALLTELQELKEQYTLHRPC
jgi:glycerol-3-phosphate O-acyltransferase